MAQTLPPHTTISYKKIGDQDVYFDLYPPRAGLASADNGEVVAVPAIVYFHGGGLTVGTRASWFPYWIHERVADLGYALLSIDYQLIPPATGHDVLSDISDFFSFIARPTTVFATEGGAGGNEIRYRIDTEAISVAGSSAGGLCAYLAATVLKPKPKAVLSMYGMGGDFLIPFYLEPKDKPYVPGRPLVNPADYKEYLFPFSLPITTTSELEYHPDNHPTPGLPANPRMYIPRLFHQLAVYLDYYTGNYEPSLSEALRNRRREILASHTNGESAFLNPEEWGSPLIPEQHRVLFPQLNVTPDWPKVMLVHGSQDYLVPLNEAQHMKDLLEVAGVEVVLKIAEGKGHSFDYEPGAEVEFERLFDEAARFLMVLGGGPS